MKKILDKICLPPWLIFVLVGVLILRIPTFFEPFSYGDEMIYLTLGEAIRQGVTLYKSIHDNKPPMLYLLAAIAGNVFWFKVILAFWSFGTIIVFWQLVKNIFRDNEKLQKIATIIFAILTTIPLFEGNIANSEIFMIGPIILAFLILLTKNLNFKNIFVSGMLFGVATLFKVPAAFDVPVIVFYWIITTTLNKKSFLEIVKNTIFLALGFLLPIALTFVWAIGAGSFKEYLIAAFLQNFGYLSSWREGTQIAKTPFLVKNGPLLIRASIVLIGSVILFLRKKVLSKNFVLISLWLLFGLFAVTLSERPYPHYLMQIVPELSIMLAILFSDQTIEQTLVIIPLTLAVFTPIYYKFWYYPTGYYYSKFVSFITHQTTKEQYFSTFGNYVNSYYKIADFIMQSSKPTDRIFVWGPESSTIYALSRRLPSGKYAAQYHINDFSSKKIEAEIISNNKPKYIVILPKSEPFNEIVNLLRKSYIKISNIEGADIWIVRTIK